MTYEAPLDRFAAGKTLRAPTINEFLAMAERLGRLNVAPPLAQDSTGRIPLIRDARDPGFWAILSGSTSPYEFNEVLPLPGGTWQTFGGRTGQVYEYNGAPHQNGLVALVTESDAGDYRTYVPRFPQGCTDFCLRVYFPYHTEQYPFPIYPPVSGVSFTVLQASQVVGSGMTDATGGGCIGTQLKAGSYAIQATYQGLTATYPITIDQNNSGCVLTIWLDYFGCETIGCWGQPVDNITVTFTCQGQTILTGLTGSQGTAAKGTGSFASSYAEVYVLPGLTIDVTASDSYYRRFQSAQCSFTLPLVDLSPLSGNSPGTGSCTITLEPQIGYSCAPVGCLPAFSGNDNLNVPFPVPIKNRLTVTDNINNVIATIANQGSGSLTWTNGTYTYSGGFSGPGNFGSNLTQFSWIGADGLLCYVGCLGLVPNPPPPAMVIQIGGTLTEALCQVDPGSPDFQLHDYLGNIIISE